jgi:hypothetical protein
MSTTTTALDEQALADFFSRKSPALCLQNFGDDHLVSFLVSRGYMVLNSSAAAAYNATAALCSRHEAAAGDTDVLKAVLWLVVMYLVYEARLKLISLYMQFEPRSSKSAGGGGFAAVIGIVLALAVWAGAAVGLDMGWLLGIDRYLGWIY